MAYRKQIIEYEVNENGCHICTSHKPKAAGYACIQIGGVKGKTHFIHRYVYEKINGEIPEGLCARHKCDTPLCINPEHIELGTHKENMSDMVIRGRSTRGTKNSRSKLDDEKIKEIRSDKASTNVALAEKFNVTHQLIALIRKNKIWNHVS